MVADEIVLLSWLWLFASRLHTSGSFVRSPSSKNPKCLNITGTILMISAEPSGLLAFYKSLSALAPQLYTSSDIGTAQPLCLSYSQSSTSSVL